MVLLTVERTIARGGGSVEVRSLACLGSELSSRKNFAQFSAENFARWCPRDDFHKVNLPGLLMVGEAVGDEVAELFGERV